MQNMIRRSASMKEPPPSAARAPSPPRAARPPPPPPLLLPLPVSLLYTHSPARAARAGDPSQPRRAPRGVAQPLWESLGAVRLGERCTSGSHGAEERCASDLYREGERYASDLYRGGGGCLEDGLHGAGLRDLRGALRGGRRAREAREAAHEDGVASARGRGAKNTEYVHVSTNEKHGIRPCFHEPGNRENVLRVPQRLPPPTLPPRPPDPVTQRDVSG